MNKSKHTPGPWITEESNRGMFGVMDERGYAIADMAVTYSSIDDDDEHEANARLIAAAPAMDLALSMIACGIARIERCGHLEEFCFDGIRYSLNGDWNALFDVIGWDKARAAIARATGATP